MKKIQINKIKVVEVSTGSEFETLVNRAVEELAARGFAATIQFNTHVNYSAYILYSGSLDIYESIREEVESQGHCFKCKNCPVYNPPEDKRRHTSLCEQQNMPVEAGRRACEWFYTEWLRGELTPISFDSKYREG